MNGLLLALLLASSEPSTQETCLRAAVFKESGAEPLAGMKGVRQVIKNRSRKTGKNWCSTIKEPSQFSFYKRGTSLSDVRIPKKWLTRYEKARKMRPVVSDDHIYFHHKSIRPSWRKGVVCDVEISNHVFCKEKT